MGNGESREAKRAARASSFSQAEYERQLGYRQGQRASLPAPGQTSVSRSFGSSSGSFVWGEKRPALTARKSFKGFSFQDTYADLPSLQQDLRKAGLESCNLMVAIDLTRSNEWSGKLTFGGRNLHSIDPTGIELNPYEASLQIIAQTLSAFDDDGYIPLWGFGDSSTYDKAVMSFLPRDQPCHGLEQCLQAYRQVIPAIKLAGPTSFGPVIRKACHVVKQSGGNYHILLIIADGQVTRSSDLPANEVSPQERDTIEAVVEASTLPLSIIVVGVGDGEDGWKAMKELDDKLPSRNYDNLQFLSLSEALTKGHRAAPGGARASPMAIKQAMEATFALQALMEVPLQYKAINTLGLMDRRAVASVHIAPVSTVDPPIIPLLGRSMTSPGSAYGANPSVGMASPGLSPQQTHSPAGSSFYGAPQASPAVGQFFPQYLLAGGGGGGGGGGAAAGAGAVGSPVGESAPGISPDGYPQKGSGGGGPMVAHQGDFGLSSLAMTTPPSAALGGVAGTARHTSSSSSASSSSFASSTSTSSSAHSGSFYYSQAVNSAGSAAALGGGYGSSRQLLPPQQQQGVGGDFVVPALSPGAIGLSGGLASPASPASPAVAGSAPPALRSPNAPLASVSSSSSSGASSAYSPATATGVSPSSPTPRPPAGPRRERASLNSSSSITASLDPTNATSNAAPGSPLRSPSRSSASQMSALPVIGVGGGAAGGAGGGPHQQQGRMSHSHSRSPSASTGTGTSAAAAAVVDDEAERLRRELEALKQQQCCSVCLEPIEDSGGARKRVAFQCGHATTCNMCSDRLDNCPQCRAKIIARIKLHM